MPLNATEARNDRKLTPLDQDLLFKRAREEAVHILASTGKNFPALAIPFIFYTDVAQKRDGYSSLTMSMTGIKYSYRVSSGQLSVHPKHSIVRSSSYLM